MGRVRSDEKVRGDMSAEDKCTVEAVEAVEAVEVEAVEASTVKCTAGTRMHTNLREYQLIEESAGWVGCPGTSGSHIPISAIPECEWPVPVLAYYWYSSS